VSVRGGRRSCDGPILVERIVACLNEEEEEEEEEEEDDDDYDDDSP
jgi:hypothetical protein